MRRELREKWRPGADVQAQAKNAVDHVHVADLAEVALMMVFRGTEDPNQAQAKTRGLVVQ